jgi:hypothetical protein
MPRSDGRGVRCFLRLGMLSKYVLVGIGVSVLCKQEEIENAEKEIPLRFLCSSY